MIQIYCGSGKGKTTAALGLCLRASGRGKKCLWTSFLKDYNSGEFLGDLPFALIKGEPVSGFVWNMTDAQKKDLSEEHADRLDRVASCAAQYDVVVLDEVFGAIGCGVLDCGQVLRFIRKLPAGCELIMTGQNPPQQILDTADYISEICPRKHPYEKGICAREGIEF